LKIVRKDSCREKEDTGSSPEGEEEVYAHPNYAWKGGSGRNRGSGDSRIGLARTGLKNFSNAEEEEIDLGKEVN